MDSDGIKTTMPILWQYDVSEASIGFLCRFSRTGEVVGMAVMPENLVN